MKGEELISYLGEKWGKNDAAIARYFDKTQPAVGAWRRKKNITPFIVMRMIEAAYRRGQIDMVSKSIKPIVEFYPIKKTRSSHKRPWKLLDSKIEHHKKLVTWLTEARGLYVFYNSEGQALYIGKTLAENMNLWVRINQSYNASKDDRVQDIYRVKYPVQNVKEFKRQSDAKRKLRKYNVSLHELASYFSAYEVADELINKLEALLVRSFANDTKNLKMENFE